ncbi:MAG: MetQ/NlpA family ABC transporter substrate-binding protein [Chlamydiales bacterium]
MKIRYLWLIALLFFTSCQSEKNTLKVAATPLPHADLLEVIRPDLEKEGIKLTVVEVDDYSLPNRLLAEKQVDANFFQHQPFLDEYNRQFGTHLVPLTRVHIEPMGIYSKKISSIGEVPIGATVAIPSDPTNSARALHLLAQADLITLKPGKNETLVTPFDIETNRKKLKIREVDAPFLPRALPDVDLALIPANFAIEAKLNPLQDALLLEESSRYANIVAIREGEENRESLQKLKEALQSEKLHQYIVETYKGAILPAS